MARDRENQKRLAKEWYERNKALAIKRAQTWQKENIERKREINAKWREENREQHNAISRVWNSNNKDKKAAYQAKRRAAQLLRTPKWLSADDWFVIEEAYNLAQLRTQHFGFPWHVDHIIPLQGKFVSGLHVPNNLQVIPGEENSEKSNKYSL